METNFTQGLICLGEVAVGLIGSLLIALITTGIIYGIYRIIKKINKDGYREIY